MVKRWLNPDPASDASGLTFVEWDPTKDANPDAPPVQMIVNASEVRGAGFKLKERMPLELDSSVRVSSRKRGARVRNMEGMGEKKLVMSTSDDDCIREGCE